MATEQEAVLTPRTQGPSALRLDISGANFMLTGTFEQWVPLTMKGLKEERAVQLLVDVTSSTLPRLAPANTNGALFSFEAQSIKRGQNGGHRVKGVLTYGKHHADTEVFMQAPPAHSPFAVLSFQLPSSDFEGLWKALEKRASVNAAANGTEVRARGWLRPPTVAAA